MLNSKVGAPKVGAFRDWEENDEAVEIFLPLPPATVKKELVCVIMADSLTVRHTRLQQTLLLASPLAGPVMSDESTWYVQGEQLIISLAKQWRGQTKSDQYWGGSLAAPGGKYECYMTLRELREVREARQAKERELEKQRHERIKASERAAREKEMEEEREEAREAAALERRRARRRRVDDDDDDDIDDDYDGDARRSQRRRQLRQQQANAKKANFMDWRVVLVATIVISVVRIAYMLSNDSSGRGLAETYDHWLDEEH